MLRVKLTKVQVARRQLGTALALFIEDVDPVSVHTLACAGGEVAEYLTRNASAQPFAEHALATIPGVTIREIRDLQHQFSNAFKHATTKGGEDRNDHALLERFNDLQNDHALFVGWYDYQQAVQALPIEAQAFQAWYFALYPEKLSPDVDQSVYERLFPALRAKFRKAQKQALHDAVVKARGYPAVMNDEKTEQSPLILGDA